MKESGISVIVAYYRNLPFLELVLQGLNAQSFHHFEVILAEDDNNPETLDFIETNRAIVYHLHHPKLAKEENVKFNYDLLMEKMLKGKIRCTNGLHHTTDRKELTA